MWEGGARHLVEASLRHAGLSGRLPRGRWCTRFGIRSPPAWPEDGASATEIQALLGDESLNTSQGHIDATANQTPGQGV